MPQCPDKELSDRSIMSGPSIELVMSLLEKQINLSTDIHAVSRLAAALASCAQLGSLGIVNIFQLFNLVYFKLKYYLTFRNQIFHC